MSVDRWLEARLGRPRAGEVVLVLCRSRATVTRVRRWMAERGGWIGADVVTPHGLVASIHRDPLGFVAPEPERVLPADNPLAATISDRPGLVAAARRWTRRAREREAVGLPIEGVPDWLIALASSDWSAHDDVRALAGALERLRADPLHPTESHAYDRVVHLGFDTGPEILEPGALAVAGLLGAPPTSIPDPEPTPLPSVEVPDAVAEARLAAWLCAERPDDCLVLVSETSTARRLRDTLRRNGLSAGFTDPPPAASSALGGLTLRVTPWFTEPDPPLRVSDVAWVFGHRVLGRHLKPPAERALERERLEAGLDDPELVRPGRRDLFAMLREAKVLDAPLSRWLGRLAILVAGVDRDPKIRGAALALSIRLRMLRARIAGQTLDKAFSDPGPAWDDFDDLVAELLGDEAGASAVQERAGSLGGLRQFLIDLRPRVHDDPAARAVLGALRDRDDVPADHATAREALGSPVDAAQLGAGVDVIAYDDWDGRPAGRLILLDVHHKGLARRPTPDPLLDEGEQRALGVPAGQELVDFRIATVHRAAAVADEVIAVVARRDAGGRDLVPPIQLQLVPREAPNGRSYGLELDLPERRRSRALEVRHDPDTQPPQPGVLGALALQATAEWYRSGRGPAPPSAAPRVVDRFAALDERLHALRPLAPDWVMPWLGHAEGVPEASLPDRAWSTSRLFEPMAACMYRAFVKAVLRIDRAEEVPEDLDPREIGVAIHDALEEVGSGLQLRVPKEQLEGARQTVVEALRQSTRERLQRARDELEGLSEARQAAVTGRQERWNAHWPSWARSRVRPHETPSPYERKQFIRSHPLTVAAAEVMRQTVGGAGAYASDTLCAWLTETGVSAESGAAVHTWPPGLLARDGERWGGLSSSMAGGLQAFLDTPTFADVVRVCKSARIRANGLGEPIVATGVELPFGPGATPGRLATPEGVRPLHLGEVSVRIGREDVRLSGRIDRVVLTRYHQRPLFEIVDYKTSRSQPRNDWGIPKDLWSGRKPQLMVYALALRAAVASGRLEPELPDAAVASVGWDYVRFTEADPASGDRRAEPNKFGRFLVDNVVLDQVAERLGTLLDDGRDGRWTLMPLPSECPALGPWGGFCDASDACRLRALPPQEDT